MIRRVALLSIVALVLGCKDKAAGTGEAEMPAESQTKSQAPGTEALARQTVEHILAGRFDESRKHFDATMTEKLPASTIAEVMKEVHQLAGDISGIDSVTIEKHGDAEVASVTVKGASSNLLFTVSVQGGKVSGLFVKPVVEEAKAPAYAKPESFSEQTVEFGAEGWKLPGLIAVPKDCKQGTAAGVVLVHGSGPGDRDASIMGRKPFRDIAQGLASRGVAVLRYDKRTKVHGAKFAELPQATVKEETIEDAVLAAKLLSEHACTNSRRIYVLGHSLGGYVAPRIAAAAAAAKVELAGLIIASGNTRKLETLVVEQTKYMLSLKGDAATDEERAAVTEIETQAANTAKVKTPTDNPGPLLLGLTAPYVADLNAYDPIKAARALRLPVLVLQGEADYQVTLDDFAGWKKALGHRKGVVYKSYPKVDHLLARGDADKSRPEDYMKPLAVYEPVVADIAHFVGN